MPEDEAVNTCCPRDILSLEFLELIGWAEDRFECFEVGFVEFGIGLLDIWHGGDDEVFFERIEGECFLAAA